MSLAEWLLAERACGLGDRGRFARSGARQLWLVGALGGVAFLMWRAQRRRARPPRALVGPAPRATPSATPGAERREVGSTLAPSTPVPSTPVPSTPVPSTRLAVAPPASTAGLGWGLPRHAAGGRSPWIERASVAIHLGQPDELSRIARELSRAGLPAAAGLLENYALLLARPCARRERVLTEVTRMLASALDEPRVAAPRAEPPPAQASAHGPDPRRGSAGTRAARPAARPRARLPMPERACGERRRASR